VSLSLGAVPSALLGNLDRSYLNLDTLLTQRCALVQSGVALTDLSPLRLQQLQDSWRSRRRLSEPTVASFGSSTARKEQVQRDMVKQFIADQVGLTDLNPQQLQAMTTIWDAKKGC
jgi:hypothetical protein